MSSPSMAVKPFCCTFESGHEKIACKLKINKFLLKKLKLSYSDIFV